MKWLNKYSTVFYVRCPNNQKKIRYNLTIRTSSVIMVEDLTSKVSAYKEQHHEAIADDLLRSFGGHQILIAHHHGVDIKTVRSSNET